MDIHLEKIKVLLMADEESARLALQLLKGQKELKKEVEHFFSPLLDALKRKSLSSLPSFFKQLERKNQTKREVKRNLLFILEHSDFLPYLNGLGSLNLYGMDLEQVPEAIGTLINLKSLNLCNNSLTELPDFIGNLDGVKGLHLSKNQLTSVPIHILQGLNDLYGLDLRLNSIEEEERVRIKTNLRHVNQIWF